MIGRGEAETIVLAEELNADSVLIDDLKARKFKRQFLHIEELF